MVSPSEVLEKIPFARKTIKELVEVPLPRGVKIYPEKDMAAMASIFPNIVVGNKTYRSILLLVGKADLPNSTDFALPEEFEPQNAKPIKPSKGAMVVFERNCNEHTTDLLFTIYIDKQYCPPRTGKSDETNRLIRRNETFAMELLCAVTAYSEIEHELLHGGIRNLVPFRHPTFEEAFELLCPDEKIITVALKYYKKSNPTLAEISDFFASDHGPSTPGGYLIPEFWSYWQQGDSLRAHLVGKRLREIALEVTRHPKFKVKRPVSAAAVKLFRQPTSAKSPRRRVDPRHEEN
jgi:hypothetical protein